MTENDERVRDPVCGMRFPRDQAAAWTQVEGHTVYFCAEGCRDIFEETPWRYTELQNDVTDEGHD